MHNLLQNLACKNGASIFGVARLDKEEEEKFGLPIGITIGVHLSEEIIRQIEDRPTKLYSYHYKQVNYLLDRIALLITDAIQKKKKKALPIPASQIIDWEGMKGSISHKKVAYLGGIGWIGRSSLLITEEFGAKVRLVTVLTDLELLCGKPKIRDCGECKNCISFCPAKAIKGSYEELDLKSCINQLEVFRKRDNIGHHICGICVKACF